MIAILAAVSQLNMDVWREGVRAWDPDRKQKSGQKILVLNQCDPV